MEERNITPLDGVSATTTVATNPLIPQIDFLKRPLPADSTFFVVPKNIGKLLAAHSDWIPSKPPSIWDRLRQQVPAVATGLGSGIILNALLQLELWPLILLSYAVPVAIAGLIVALLGRTYWTNLFLGLEGFSFYQRRPRKTELYKAHDVRWDEISGLRLLEQEILDQGTFRGTRHQYRWYGLDGKTVIFSQNIVQPPEEEGSRMPAKLAFQKSCNLHYTKWLLQRLDQKLDSQGCETFDYQPVLEPGEAARVELSREKLILRGRDGEASYYFDDVARLYWQVEAAGQPKKKIDKVAFFVERAEAIGVSVNSLSNASYFHAALGKILDARFPEV